MQKLSNLRKMPEDLKFLLTTSVLPLILMAISLHAALTSGFSFSFSPESEQLLEIPPRAFEEASEITFSLFSPENTESLKKIGEYVDIKYTLGGIGLVILLLSIYQFIVAIKITGFPKKFQGNPQEISSPTYPTYYNKPSSKPSEIIKL